MLSERVLQASTKIKCSLGEQNFVSIYAYLNVFPTTIGCSPIQYGSGNQECCKNPGNCQVIVNSIVNAATCEQQSQTSVSDKTYKTWKELFPWLVIELDDQLKVNLKCSLCMKSCIKMYLQILAQETSSTTIQTKVFI